MILGGSRDLFLTAEWGPAIISAWLWEFPWNGRRQRRRKLFINCGQRQKDRQVVVMNEWGGACGEGECLLAPPTPQPCSQARAASLPSNRVPASGWKCAQLAVKWPKCLPSDPLRSHQPARGVGAGGSQRPWHQQTPWPLHVVRPWGRGSGLGSCPSLTALFRVSSTEIALKPFLLDSSGGTSALSFKIAWELQI